MERYNSLPKPVGWAKAVSQAWESRRLAAPCGCKDLFCDCDRCAALPERPWWMNSLSALKTTALHVATAAPSPSAWRMHAIVHEELGDWATAARSWKCAAKICGLQQGGGAHKAMCVQSARACLEKSREMASVGLKVEPTPDAPTKLSGTAPSPKAKGSPTSVLDM